MFPVSPGIAYVGVAGAFVAGSAVSLIDPGRFYDLALPLMLLALFASEAIVFAVFPAFRRRVAGGVYLVLRSSGALGVVTPSGSPPPDPASPRARPRRDREPPPSEPRPRALPAPP